MKCDLTYFYAGELHKLKYGSLTTGSVLQEARHETSWCLVSIFSAVSASNLCLSLSRWCLTSLILTSNLSSTGMPCCTHAGVSPSPLPPLLTFSSAQCHVYVLSSVVSGFLLDALMPKLEIAVVRYVGTNDLCYLRT